MNPEYQINFVPNDNFCMEQIQLNKNGKTATPTEEEGPSGQTKTKAVDSHVQPSTQNSKGKRKTPPVSEKSGHQEKKNKNKRSKVHNQCQKDHENVDLQLSGESDDSSNELRSLSSQTLSEKCHKYELLRENYKNLRHNYLHLRRRYEESELLLKAISPIRERQQKERDQVQEIMELQGPDLVPVKDILEVEEDKNGSQWNLNFIETDGLIWKVRWTKE